MKKIYTGMTLRFFWDLIARGSFFAINIFVARQLGVVEFGRFAYTIGLVQMLYPLTELGTHTQMMAELGAHRADPKPILSQFWVLKLFLLTLSLLLLAPFFKILAPRGSPLIILYAMIWMLSNSMLDFLQAAYNGLDRIESAGKSLLWQRVGMFVGAVLPLIYFKNFQSVLMGLGLGSALGMGLAGIFFYKSLGLNGDWKNGLKQGVQILRRSVPIGMTGVMGQFWVRFGAVLLGWIATDHVVGVYSTAFRIFETTYLLPGAILAVGLPHLSQALATGDVLFRKQWTHMIRLVGGLSLLWGIFLFFGSPWLVPLLFGYEFSEAVPLLKIFGGVSVFVFMNHLGSGIMVVLSQQKRHTVHVLLTFLLAVCFFTLLSGKGPGGVAFAFLLTEASLFLFTLRYLIVRIYFPSRRRAQ